jgi:hypothetical protein
MRGSGPVGKKLRGTSPDVRNVSRIARVAALIMPHHAHANVDRAHHVTGSLASSLQLVHEPVTSPSNLDNTIPTMSTTSVGVFRRIAFLLVTGVGCAGALLVAAGGPSRGAALLRQFALPPTSLTRFGYTQAQLDAALPNGLTVDDQPAIGSGLIALDGGRYLGITDRGPNIDHFPDTPLTPRRRVTAAVRTARRTRCRSSRRLSSSSTRTTIASSWSTS